MSERFTLEAMGPVITPTMRAARNDEMEQAAPHNRMPHMDCAYPGCPFPAFPHQSRTLYEDPASNWHLLCETHAADTDEYWDERWAEYHAGCM